VCLPSFAHRTTPGFEGSTPPEGDVRVQGLAGEEPGAARAPTRGAEPAAVDGHPDTPGGVVAEVELGLGGVQVGGGLAEGHLGSVGRAARIVAVLNVMLGTDRVL
jgi:hypothetical protein